MVLKEKKRNILGVSNVDLVKGFAHILNTTYPFNQKQSTTRLVICARHKNAKNSNY